MNFHHLAAADALGAVTRNNRCDPANTRVMEPHFHAWLRFGRIFTIVTRPFADRTTVHRWATRQWPDRADRLILACEHCPPTRPSKRRPPRWATVARQVAAAVGAELPSGSGRTGATRTAAEAAAGMAGRSYRRSEADFRPHQSAGAYARVPREAHTRARPQSSPPPSAAPSSDLHLPRSTTILAAHVPRRSTWLAV